MSYGECQHMEVTDVLVVILVNAADNIFAISNINRKFNVASVCRESKVRNKKSRLKFHL